MVTRPKLGDRAYVVTGGGGGIGHGIAVAILADGGKVVLADIDGAAAARVARQLDPEGASVVPIACDVTSPDDAERAAAAAADRFGRLDGLVNGAGIITLDTAWDAASGDWNRQLEVNVTGSFVMARAVGQVLKRSEGGSIVNVASNAGKVGYPNMAAYNASKAAVISLTRSLSLEWAADGINVNAVCPGGVETPMLAGVAEWLAPRLDTGAEALLAEMGPAQLGRRIQPVEVGRVVAFLLSDDAAIIRGQSINVDGGDTPY